jgi:hypothetical protein
VGVGISGCTLSRGSPLRRDGPAVVAKVWGSVVMGAGAMPRR